MGCQTFLGVWLYADARKHTHALPIVLVLRFLPFAERLVYVAELIKGEAAKVIVGYADVTNCNAQQLKDA